MISGIESKTTGNPSPVGLSDNLRYRLADLVYYLEVDPATAERVERLLTSPNGGLPPGPYASKIGQHLLVMPNEFARAYAVVTATPEEGALS